MSQSHHSHTTSSESEHGRIIEVIGEKKASHATSKKWLIRAAGAGVLGALLWFALPGTLLKTSVVGSKDAVLLLEASPSVIQGVGGVSDISIKLNPGT